jgi:hypothetical protein
VLIATCFVLIAACVSVVGLAWHWVNQERSMRDRAAADALEASRRMALALAQSEAANHEMIKQLQDISAAIRHPRSPDWNPVTFKLSEETPGGPGVSKARLVLLTLPNNLSRVINRTSDENGNADFGSVQPGDYEYRITRTWTGGFATSMGQLNVQAGSEVHKNLVVPKVPPLRVTVKIRFLWPLDLEKERLVVYAPLALQDRTIEPGVRWTFYNTVSSREKVGANSDPRTTLQQVLSVLTTHPVLFGPASTQAEILQLRGLRFWTLAGDNPPDGVTQSAKLGPGSWADVLAGDIRDLNDHSGPMRWAPGNYGLNELIVLRQSESANVEEGRRRFDVLASCRPHTFWHAIDVRSKPPEIDDLKVVYALTAGPAAQFGGADSGNSSATGLHPSIPTVELPAESWSECGDGFRALPGEVNEWTIRMPDALVKSVRETLKNMDKHSRQQTSPANRT